jgi:anti-sigma regulatory factor (Ser/Thr protein kinase)
LARFDLPSAPGNEREAMRRVSDAVRHLGLPQARLERLETAVAEATMNAMEHGNRYREDAPVTVRVVASAGDLRIQVRDRGGGPPAAIPADPPDLRALLEGGGPVRGWGLFLIRSLVDQVHVSVDEAGHTVELVMHLVPPGDAGTGT